MQELYHHINKYVILDQKEFQEISSFFETRSVNKKEIIYTAGNHDLKHFFVIRGCLHMYFINERGAEQTLQFAIPNWWITDHLAFKNNRSSEFNIQAVKPTIMLHITHKNYEALLLHCPKMETYFRNIYETAYGAAIMRMKYIFSYSKEEIYFKFRDAYPNFVQQVPQYLVATFLGLSPEYVSKLRRKSIS